MKNAVSKFFQEHMAFHYAVSMAASWAWGTSLVVGMSIVQTRGTLPFLLWAIANSLALPLFGLVAFRIKKLDRVIDSKPVQVFTTMVQVFALWIQMNAIYEILHKNTGFLSHQAAVFVAIGLAIFFLVLLFNNGLMRSVIADQPIWAVVYTSLIAIILIGFTWQTGFNEISWLNNQSDIAWAFNSMLILFSGPLMDIQNWNVARKVKSEDCMKAYTYAGGLFALYLCGVYVLANLQFNTAMNVFLVIAILGVATSTVDNAIVGVQRIAGKKVGFCIAAVAIVFWQQLIDLGVVGLWSTMGNYRKAVLAVCIVIALGWQWYENRKEEKYVIKKL